MNTKESLGAASSRTEHTIAPIALRQPPNTLRPDVTVWNATGRREMRARGSLNAALVLRTVLRHPHRAQGQELVKDQKADKVTAVKTWHCRAASPPGPCRRPSPGDPVCLREGPGPSPWHCWPQGWWGCSGWEALAWAPSGASARWYGGWCSAEERLWGLRPDPERLSGVEIGSELAPGARRAEGDCYTNLGLMSWEKKR